MDILSVSPKISYQSIYSLTDDAKYWQSHSNVVTCNLELHSAETFSQHRNQLSSSAIEFSPNNDLLIEFTRPESQMDEAGITYRAWYDLTLSGCRMEGLCKSHYINCQKIYFDAIPNNFSYHAKFQEVDQLFKSWVSSKITNLVVELIEMKSTPSSNYNDEFNNKKEPVEKTVKIKTLTASTSQTFTPPHQRYNAADRKHLNEVIYWDNNSFNRFGNNGSKNDKCHQLYNAPLYDTKHEFSYKPRTNWYYLPNISVSTILSIIVIISNIIIMFLMIHFLPKILKMTKLSTVTDSSECSTTTTDSTNEQIQTDSTHVHRSMPSSIMTKRQESSNIHDNCDNIIPSLMTHDGEMLQTEATQVEGINLYSI